MAKIQVSQIRALHAHLGDMLSQFDAQKAAGGAVESPAEDDNDDSNPAMDSAPRTGRGGRYGVKIAGSERMPSQLSDAQLGRKK
jgi:hypothetical protein